MHYVPDSARDFLLDDAAPRSGDGPSSASFHYQSAPVYFLTLVVGALLAADLLIGLFGDPGVQARHAVITKQGSNYAIRNLAVQEGTFVNGNRIETVELHDGDRIRISDYEMSFHSRAGAQAANLGATRTPSPTAATPMATSVGGSGASASTAQSAANGQAYLAGHNGDRFTLRPGATARIGRALDNDIVVTDASVSRHHAAIEAVNGHYRLRDLGSQNGTFIGGARITEAALGNGDAVKIGDAEFTFHA